MVPQGRLPFAKKVKGRKIENKIGIPENLTMRDCVSLVAQVFDPTGWLTLIAGFKLDKSTPSKWPQMG